MSWFSKTVKKATRSIKKHMGSHWWVPGYSLVKGMGELSGGVYDEYKRNEGMYNRMALMIGGSILTGGALGAAVGATEVGGLTAATGAVTGAANAAAGGIAAAGYGAYQEHKINKEIAEQERIQKEAQEQQEKLARMEALQQAASTPGEQSFLDITGRSRQRSQIKKTQVSRGRKVGGSGSTLG